MIKHPLLGRRLVVTVIVMALAAGCSVRETLATPGCANGSGLIAAQSVPGATLVPCLSPLPTGWEVATVQIDQDGTKVVMDSDRAGDTAAVFHFVADCDTGPAISTPTDQVESVTSERIETARFEHIESVAPSFRADRYYLFDGGCVWWRFDFDQHVTSALSVDLGNSLLFFTRKALNDNVRESFIDEEI